MGASDAMCPHCEDLLAVVGFGTAELDKDGRWIQAVTLACPRCHAEFNATSPAGPRLQEWEANAG